MALAVFFRFFFCRILNNIPHTYCQLDTLSCQTRHFRKCHGRGRTFSENDRRSNSAGFCGQIQCGPGHYLTQTLFSQCGVVSAFTTQTDQYMLAFDAPVTDLLVGSWLMYCASQLLWQTVGENTGPALAALSNNVFTSQCMFTILPQHPLIHY